PAVKDVPTPLKAQIQNLPRQTSPHRESSSDLTWIRMDSMPNVYGVSNADINPLAYDPWNNSVAMIYRGHLNYQPPNPTTGSLWYGFSSNELASWTRIGKLNADIEQYARYPSATISNPTHSPSQTNVKFIYSFPHLTGGSAFGTLGYGSDPYLENTPFTVLTPSSDYGSQTYTWVDENQPNVYFLVERTGPPYLIEFWRSTNQGGSWSITQTWDATATWTTLWSERGQKVGSTIYVEAVAEPLGNTDPLMPMLTKSTDNGVTWTDWETVDWRTIPALSQYDDVGSIDERISHDFVVDAYGFEHIFISLIDVNIVPEKLDIVEIYRTPNGWNANIIAPRTLSFVPGFVALTQMDCELFASINVDRTYIAVKWVDAPAEGESAGDIFIRGRSITGVWGPIMNVTQTSGPYGREMSTHLAPRMKLVGNTATVYLTKTEQLVVVPDSMLDDTQPCAIWGASFSWNVGGGPIPPTPYTLNSTNISFTSATLNGTVNPNGLSTDVYFEWGSTTMYGNTTPQQNIGNGVNFVNVNSNISGLQPNTTYHFRVSAINSTDTSSGEDRTFVTLSPPTINPKIVLVKDIPFDQGGNVLVKWVASALDTNVNQFPYYGVWRAIPTMLKNDMHVNLLKQIKNESKKNNPGEGELFGYTWQWVGNQPALRLPEYGYAASTLYDSSSRTNGRHYFMIVAHTSDPNVFYLSNVDSGYSVDNLPPFAPKNLFGQKVGNQIHLRWNKNLETDLQGYVLYRSVTPNINPDVIQPFASTQDTIFIDMNPLPGTISYYIIRAKDVNDNFSMKSNEVQVFLVGVKDIDGVTPNQFALYKNYPNPFNPMTMIHYDIASPSFVSLKVYDVGGNEIARIVNGFQNVGKHEATFNASSLPSGIYFYRLTAGNFVATEKMVLTK
ncbi:MAG: T9SS type A sorting domain-containing protein, partial [Ignavibacteriales bacterium]|nr:T9SS type A sorting domain-containing protein [Ignavibacteriales bacterium]